jgi:hypothetical protein
MTLTKTIELAKDLNPAENWLTKHEAWPKVK